MEPNNPRRILPAALALGLTGDALLQNAAPGVNIVLVTGTVLLAAWLLRRHAARTHSGTWAAGVCLLAAGGFALRDSPTLETLAGLGLTACALLGIFHARTGQAAKLGVLQILVALEQTARDVLRGGVQTLRRKEAWGLPLAGESRARNWAAVGRGLLLTTPLVLVFGALLGSADPVFAHFVAAAFQWDVTRVASHLLWIAAGTAVASGILHGLLMPAAPNAPAAPGAEDVPRLTIGGVETAIVLGTLDGLFGAFVLVQARYFFGGQETVLSTTGMTYAAYARHGFFELVWVAGLCLPLLLCLHAGQQSGTQKPFNALAGVMLALLFVILASALRRMNLYCSEYGLSELRLYTTAFMGWLAVVLAWFAGTVLRGQRQYFTVGAAGFAAAGVFALFVLNPDAAIVRANARHAQAGKPFDACYAASLSADAVPELVRWLPLLPVPAQQVTASRLLARWGTPVPADWRSWNAARKAAQRAVQNKRARLTFLSTAAPAHACEPAEE